MFKQIFADLFETSRKNHLQSKRFIRAPLTSKIVVHLRMPNAEVWKQPTKIRAKCSNMPTKCLNKSCKFHSRSLLASQLFKRRFQNGRGGSWRSSRFELECCWVEMLLKVWDVKRETKRFVFASNLNELKEKGKTR